jgi:hypothetical protein
MSYFGLLLTLFGDEPVAPNVGAGTEYTFTGGLSDAENGLGKVIANTTKSDIDMTGTGPNLWTRSGKMVGQGRTIAITDLVGTRATTTDLAVAGIRDNPEADVRVIVMDKSRYNADVGDYLREMAPASPDYLKARVLVFTTDGNGFTLADDFVQEVGPNPLETGLAPNPGFLSGAIPAQYNGGASSVPASGYSGGPSGVNPSGPGSLNPVNPVGPGSPPPNTSGGGALNPTSPGQGVDLGNGPTVVNPNGPTLPGG